MTDPATTEEPAAEPAQLPRQAAVLLFLFALALRLPLLPRHFLAEGDGVHYVTLARAILAGDASGLANAYWSNLWPGVIAAVAWVTRLDVVTAGRLASLAAGCGLAVATAALAARALGRPTGILAGVLVAGHPWLVHFSTLLFAESLFSLLLVLLLRQALRRPGVPGSAATGVWAGLAVLTRPEAQAAIAAVAVRYGATGRSEGWGRAARRVAVFLAVALAFLTARALLIRHYGGGWDFGGTKATANLFVGLAETDHDKERVSTELTAGDENALARSAKNVSLLAFARAQPGRLARHVLRNGGAIVAASLRVFPFVPLVGGRPPLWTGEWPLVLVAGAVGLSGVALAGLAWAVKTSEGARLLAATGCLYGLGLAPFTVHDRLVLALTPLFLVFLAHGLVRGVPRLLPGSARAQRALVAGAVLFGIVSFARLVGAPRLDYAGDPPVLREAGEWLAARYPQDTILMTAAPCVDFYFHDAAHPGRAVSLPWADAPRVLGYARSRAVGVLAVAEWHLRATRHPAAGALLDPSACENDLRHVATLGSGDKRILLYELRPPATP